jgi:hypothetical protein
MSLDWNSKEPEIHPAAGTACSCPLCCHVKYRINRMVNMPSDGGLYFQIIPETHVTYTSPENGHNISICLYCTRPVKKEGLYWVVDNRYCAYNDGRHEPLKETI